MTATLIGPIDFRAGATTTAKDTGSETERVWLVQSTSSVEPIANIIGATGVNFIEPNPDNSEQLSQTFTVTNHQNEPLLWEVRVGFSTSLGDKEEEEREPKDPLDRRTKISWGSSTYQRFVEYDRDDLLIVNSAVERFVDVPGIDDVRWIIRIEKNVTSVPQWVLNYENRLNDATVTVDGVQFDAELLKMQSLQISDQRIENRVKYRNVKFELHYRSEGWTLDIADAGLNEYVVVDGDAFHRPIKIRFFADDGTTELAYDNPTRRPVTQPWPLNSDGTAKKTSVDIVDRLRFDVYKTADFTVLPGVT